jgi:hypothetical protein
MYRGFLALYRSLADPGFLTSNQLTSNLYLPFFASGNFMR